MPILPVGFTDLAVQGRPERLPWTASPGLGRKSLPPLLGGAKSCPNSNRQIAWQESLGCEICGCHSPSVSVSFETSREEILEDMPDGN
jgi:hypothetical protein